MSSSDFLLALLPLFFCPSRGYILLNLVVLKLNLGSNSEQHPNIFISRTSFLHLHLISSSLMKTFHNETPWSCTSWDGFHRGSHSTTPFWPLTLFPTFHVCIVLLRMLLASVLPSQLLCKLLFLGRQDAKTKTRCKGR